MSMAVVAALVGCVDEPPFPAPQAVESKGVLPSFAGPNEIPTGPEGCGWDEANEYNMCGGDSESEPAVPMSCPAGLQPGGVCPINLDVASYGCCDPDGDAWFCDEDWTTRIMWCGGQGV